MEMSSTPVFFCFVLLFLRKRFHHFLRAPRRCLQRGPHNFFSHIPYSAKIVSYWGHSQLWFACLESWPFRMRGKWNINTCSPLGSACILSKYERAEWHPRSFGPKNSEQWKYSTFASPTPQNKVSYYTQEGNLVSPKLCLKSSLNFRLDDQQ